MNKKAIFQLSNYLVQCFFRKNLPQIYKSDEEWINLIIASQEEQNNFLLPIENTILYNNGYNEYFIRSNLSNIFFISINNDYKRYQIILKQLINKKAYYNFNLDFHTFIYIHYINNLLSNFHPTYTNEDINKLLKAVRTDITGKYYYNVLNILSINLKKGINSYIDILYSIYEYPNNEYYWRNYNFYDKRFLQLTLQYDYELAKLHIPIKYRQLNGNNSLYTHKLKLNIYALNIDKLNIIEIFDILNTLIIYPQLLYLIPQNKLYQYIYQYICNNYKSNIIFKDFQRIMFFYKKIATDKQKQCLELYMNEIEANYLLNNLTN